MKAVKHLGWFVLALALFLTGCGTDSASTDAESKEKKGPTPEEILQSTSKANEDLNSYDMDMSMDMDVKATGLDQSMTTTANGTIVMDPLSSKLSMESMGEQFDMYIKDNMIYMYEPASAMWLKMDAESEIGASLETDQVAEPLDEQIQQVKDLADNIKVSETDSEYVLDVVVAEDKMMSFMEEQMGAAGESIESLGNFTFDKFNYTISIDKETNYPKNIKLDMVMNMEDAGDEATVNAVVDMNYDNFNATESIDIPAEAESAVDISDQAALTY
ncbi:hypothetical protein SAMN05421663_101667 [Terribacillus halophilus]|uniref:Outer membrane lipoprotein-sorting protein n=1 Tax=Terribacillus halophilus TaxID=361279 RepID=A0A1G6JQT0_9BACI|nr:DUF6612 family protein [Terribacillus halophilus]SDC21053.1 hypothetical protein SAMN05421663_101667 [Terribacillus halophilus]